MTKKKKWIKKAAESAPKQAAKKAEKPPSESTAEFAKRRSGDGGKKVARPVKTLIGMSQKGPSPTKMRHGMYGDKE